MTSQLHWNTTDTTQKRSTFINRDLTKQKFHPFNSFKSSMNPTDPNVPCISFEEVSAVPTAPALGAGPVPAVPAVLAPDAPAPPPAAKWAKGTEVSIAGLRIQCKALLGRGSFSEAWGRWVVMIGSFGGRIHKYSQYSQ